MILSECLKLATDQLAGEDIPTARLDALLIIAFVLNTSKAQVLANLDRQINKTEYRALSSLLKRRAKREPMAYILGTKEFFGISLMVNPCVLIPRPETEQLVEFAINEIPNKSRVIELGTGSGAISIAVKRSRPDLKITATDISSPALELAKQNATKYLTNDITFKLSDLTHDITGSFDAVMANLPYLPSEINVEPEINYEPSSALYAGEDGLQIYTRLFGSISSCLKPDGLLIIEALPSQAKELLNLADSAKLNLKTHREFLYVFSN